MKTFNQLLESATSLREGINLLRKDIRIDPSSPSMGPYFVVLATYKSTLTEENQDTLPITKLERDDTTFESFSELEAIFKERAEDAFDPRGRSLNGKEPVWKLDMDNERYHITSNSLLQTARQRQIQVDLLRPQLKYPDTQSPPASKD